jgi:hypothetical protein
VRDWAAALLGSQRGVALPLALITLLVLASLLLGLSVISAIEPGIAANQLRTAQARGLAEAGLERALWALAHPAAPQGLADPLPAVVPSPYDGSVLVRVAADGVLGGFRLTIGPGASATQRDVVAAGWAPSDDSSDGRVKATRRVAATAMRLRAPVDSAPCALCVAGGLEIAAGAVADARDDTSCGAKLGAWTSGPATLGAGAGIWGADGNATPNEAGDLAQGQPAEAARAWAFTEAELGVLRRLAKARGTYYRGSVVFDGSHPLPDGLVFVDTVSGASVTEATADADLARALVRTGAGLFRGWLVVRGSLEVLGDARLRGLAYALDGFAYRGASPGGIEGQVVAQAVRGGVTAIARESAGPAIRFDCSVARSGDGLVPGGWFLKPGSYREIPES